MKDIAAQCVGAADELLARLNKVKPQDGRTPWASLRQAVISVWSKEEVNEMVSRLDTYRNELALQTLVVLNEKVGGHMKNHGQRFDRLEHKDDDIIEAISISQRRGAREAATYHQKTQEQFREVISAILTHRDGQTTTLSQPIQQATTPWALADEDLSRQCMTLQTVKPSDKSNKSRLDATASFSDFTVIQHRLLERLSFRKIRDRQDEVSPADQDTFRWILDTPKLTQRPWSNFSEWVRRGEGCYWINGKAGSGKSTLMKYMVNNQGLKRALSEWAGETRLLVASYFSWNLGSPLQKSQVGLLRSLLHDILDQVPDLIPTVLPKLFRAASADAREEPSLLELKNGILKLTRQTDIPLRICLFVDGIDEFDGDHIDLVNLFVSIPSAQCKVIVSSRPLPACFDAFAGCPSLRLQDLTHGDIRSYANKKVRTHKRWREFLEEEGQEAEKIVDVIAEKAEGVFLWVVLAVASLLEGLRNYDRLMDFERRLEILPPDLENLYSHMLNKMQPLYLRQASQLLQIVLQHTEFEADEPFSALQLSFADEENPERALSQEIGELPMALRLSKCRAMEGRLRSRCCGLLEIWQDWRLGERDRILKSRVIFLHRTVVEFLQNPNVISDLLLHTTAIGFDPNIALAKGFLIDVKTQPPVESPDVQSPAWQSMRRCLLFCRIGENDTSQRTEVIIKELDKIMKARYNTPIKKSVDQNSQGDGGGQNSSSLLSSSSSSQKFDWTATELMRPCFLGNFKGFDLSQASIFVLAATLGLRQYVFDRCTSGPSKMKFAQVQQAMRAVVFRASCLTKELISPQQSDSWASMVEAEKGREGLKTYNCIVDDLLIAGADPNHSLGVDGYSPWALALTFTETLPISNKALDWYAMLSLFLAFGADPNESIKEEDRHLIRHKTVLSMLTTKISKHLARQKIRENPQYSARQKTKEPAANDEVIQSMTDLKNMLIQRGAKNREWSEPIERKTQRDSTPAPWGRSREAPKVSEHGYARPNQLSLRKTLSAHRDDDSSLRSFYSGDVSTSSEDSGPDNRTSNYANEEQIQYENHGTVSDEDFENDSSERSVRRGRRPTRRGRREDHSGPKGKDDDDDHYYSSSIGPHRVPMKTTEPDYDDFAFGVLINNTTSAVDHHQQQQQQQEGRSNLATIEQLQSSSSNAQPSLDDDADDPKNGPKSSILMNLVKRIKRRKSKFLSTFFVRQRTNLDSDERKEKRSFWTRRRGRRKTSRG